MALWGGRLFENEDLAHAGSLFLLARRWSKVYGSIHRTTCFSILHILFMVLIKPSPMRIPVVRDRIRHALEKFHSCILILPEYLRLAPLYQYTQHPFQHVFIHLPPFLIAHRIALS